MFPNVDKSVVREGKTKTIIEKTKQKLLRKNLLVLTKAQVQQDHPKTSRKCDQDCHRKWSKLQKLWNRTDQVIQTMIAHTKKDPRPHKKINWMEKRQQILGKDGTTCLTRKMKAKVIIARQVLPECCK